MDGITLEEDFFGRIKKQNENGKTEIELIRRFTLANENGMSVQIINYGAAISSIKVPDKDGKVEDVVLGYDTFEEYANHPYYFGATIGRCANRISNGMFKIANHEYILSQNDMGLNHLHGGEKGFDKVLWESHVEGTSVTLSYLSPVWDQGYPGEVLAHVTYQLTSDNELKVHHKATSTHTTPLNMTNHSYFNLGGHGSGPIYNHDVSIFATNYLPKNVSLVPTGEILPVDCTLFDLRSPVTLLEVVPKVPDGGFDHHFCIDGETGVLRPVARVSHSPSGRQMEVYSTQHGVQFYTANFFPLDDSVKGKGCEIYRRHGAFCLETQCPPDAVNQPKFPNCLVGSGDVYDHSTVFKFSFIS